MTEQEIRDTIRMGGLIECAEDEYPDTRRKLQQFAAWSVDHKQDIHAIIALNEVKRLDYLFNYDIWAAEQ